MYGSFSNGRIGIRCAYFYHQNIISRTTVDIDDPILEEVKRVWDQDWLPQVPFPQGLQRWDPERIDVFSFLAQGKFTLFRTCRAGLGFAQVSTRFSSNGRHLRRNRQPGEQIPRMEWMLRGSPAIKPLMEVLKRRHHERKMLGDNSGWR